MKTTNQNKSNLINGLINNVIILTEFLFDEHSDG